MLSVVWKVDASERVARFEDWNDSFPVIAVARSPHRLPQPASPALPVLLAMSSTKLLASFLFWTAASSPIPASRSVSAPTQDARSSVGVREKSDDELLVESMEPPWDEPRLLDDPRSSDEGAVD